MKTYFYLFLLSSIFLSACSININDKPPKIISDGFDAYRIKDADSAITVWTSYWSKGDSVSRNTLLNGLIANERNYGKLSGYDIVKTINVGTKYQYCYLTFLYPLRPVFALFTLYQRPDGQWVVLNIEWNTDIKEVFPQNIYLK
jgi:hypothetical protein